jgi:hypothetical protein
MIHCQFANRIERVLLSYQVQYVPAALLGGHRNSLPYLYSCNATFAIRGSSLMRFFCEAGAQSKCWEGNAFFVCITMIKIATIFHKMG